MKNNIRRHQIKFLNILHCALVVR